MALLIERLHDLPSAYVADLLSESERLGSRIVPRLGEEWDNRAERVDRPRRLLLPGRLCSARGSMGGWLESVGSMSTHMLAMSVSAGCGICTSYWHSGEAGWA